MKLLKGLAEAFELPDVPRRIEVYDNSHIQGAHAVGAMIVAGAEGLLKSQYRKFNIKGDDLTPGDDFGMMKEVLGRRFKRLLKEDPERNSEAWPDVLLIDGGAGQVSAVREIMRDWGARRYRHDRRGKGRRSRCGQRRILSHRQTCDGTAAQ